MKNIINWIIGIAIIWFIFSVIGGIGKYQGENAEYWYNAYDEAAGYEQQVTELKDALEEANNNIEEANSRIDNAKSYSGESYDDMVEAIDSMHPVDTIYDPTE